MSARSHERADVGQRPWLPGWAIQVAEARRWRLGEVLRVGEPIPHSGRDREGMPVPVGNLMQVEVHRDLQRGLQKEVPSAPTDAAALAITRRVRASMTHPLRAFPVTLESVRCHGAL